MRIEKKIISVSSSAVVNYRQRKTFPVLPLPDCARSDKAFSSTSDDSLPASHYSNLTTSI